MTTIRSLKALLSCAAAVVVMTPLLARATPSAVVVEYAAPYGDYNGRTYTYVEGVMRGSLLYVPDGSTDNYEVPFFAIYPVAGPAGSGITIVEQVNSAFWRSYQEAVCGRGIPRCDELDGEAGHRLQRTFVLRALINTQDDMFNNGHTYLAIQADMDITRTFGPTPPNGERRRLAYGTIPHSTDMAGIVTDASRFVRDPGTLWDTGSWAQPALPTPTHVIGFGSSGTAGFFRKFLRDGANQDGAGGYWFDGILILITGSRCHIRADVEPIQANGFCAGVPSYPPPLATAIDVPPAGGGYDGKILAVNTETDMINSRGWQARAADTADPNYRTFEIPGVAHIPLVVSPMAYLGAVRQNPADYRPFMRNALRNLIDWVTTGTAPPTSIAMNGAPGTDPLTTMPTWVVALDSDFNATGGIRLPHMTSTTTAGEAAGAPLGIYGGADLLFEAGPGGMPPRNQFPYLGGRFVPWTAAERAFRYPTKEVFVSRITLAADELLSKDYISQEDRDRYVELANAELPEVNPSTPDGGTPGADGGPMVMGDDDGGCSCEVGGGRTAGTSWALSLLGVGLILAIRRRRS